MVIQRWQSVFLFLASVMMGIFSFIPFASQGIGEESVQFHPVDAPVYCTLNLLVAMLLLLAIFMFKNIRRQKTVTLVSVLLMVASAVAGGAIAYNGKLSIDWTGGALLLACSVVLALAAYRRMVADERLLKSYDRIR
ncbi:MAG: DUF4293 family protein [Muribaculaceae bacterium]|nr:DUF4293 family protein [Muribaculaceae bacterium]